MNIHVIETTNMEKPVNNANFLLIILENLPKSNTKIIISSELIFMKKPMNPLLAPSVDRYAGNMFMELKQENEKKLIKNRRTISGFIIFASLFK
jgi:hypothetical protein